MRIGVIASILVHIALLAWALYSVTTTRTLASSEDVPLQTELVTIGEKSNIRQGDKKAKTEATKGEKDKTKQTEKPTKSKNERVAIVAPTKKEEVKAKDPEKKEEVKVEEPKKEEPKKEEPKLEPKKEDVKKEEPKTETATVPEKKKEEPKKEEPKKVAAKDEPKKDKKAVKAKEEFDVDSVQALLDKQPDAAAQASTIKAAEKPKENPKLQPGSEQGTGTGLTISEKTALVNALGEQVGRCYQMAGGRTDADDIIVRVRIDLNPDGTLKGPPRALERKSDPLFLVAEEAAVRAIWECQPYSLNSEHYADWRAINFNFDPRKMRAISGF